MDAHAGAAVGASDVRSRPVGPVRPVVRRCGRRDRTPRRPWRWPRWTRRPAVGADGAAEGRGARTGSSSTPTTTAARDASSTAQPRGRPALLLGAPRSPGPHRGSGRAHQRRGVRRLLRHPAPRRCPDRRLCLAPEPVDRPVGPSSTRRVRALDGRVRRRRGAPAAVVGRAAGPSRGRSSSGRTGTTASTTGSATRRRTRAGGSSGCSPERRVPAHRRPATGPPVRCRPGASMFWAWQTTRPWWTIGPASCWTSSTRSRARSRSSGPASSTWAGLGLLPRGLRWPRPPARPAAGGRPPPGRGRRHTPRSPGVLRLDHGRADRGHPRLRRAPPAACCAGPSPARSRGASCSASPDPAPTWPACPPGPSATVTSGSSPVRRCGTRWPTSPTGACWWPGPTPTCPSTRG